MVVHHLMFDEIVLHRSREEMPRETAEESDIAASTQDEENSTSSKLQVRDCLTNYVFFVTLSSVSKH